MFFSVWFLKQNGNNTQFVSRCSITQKLQRNMCFTEDCELTTTVVIISVVSLPEEPLVTCEIRGDEVLLFVQIPYSGFWCFLHDHLELERSQSDGSDLLNSVPNVPDLLSLIIYTN